MIRLKYWYDSPTTIQEINDFIKKNNISRGDIVSFVMEKGFLVLSWWENNDTEAIL